MNSVKRMEWLKRLEIDYFLRAHRASDLRGNPGAYWVVPADILAILWRLKDCMGHYYVSPNFYHRFGVLFGLPIAIDNTLEEAEIHCGEYQDGLEL